MNNDTSVYEQSGCQKYENPPEETTHYATESVNVNDVDTLLTCINIWQKENKESPKLSKIDRFNNLPTTANNSPKLLMKQDFKYANETIDEDLSNMARFNSENGEDDETVEINKDENNSETKNIISDLNYPIEYDYDKEGTSEVNSKGNETTSINSTETRTCTEDSDFFDKQKYQAQNIEERESNNVTIFAEPGKKIDPINMNEKVTEINSEYTNGSTKHVEYELANCEINNLQDPENVDNRYIEELKGMIGKFINGENYKQTNQQINAVEKTQEDKSEPENKNFQEDNTLTSNNVVVEKEYDEEFENEENPILSMCTREDAIITERDILSYGKSESNLELLTSVSNENKEEQNNADMIKDVSVNCQIDQILSTKEETEPEKIRGVCYCKSDNSWTAWWTEKGKSRKKAFKLSLYGYEEARKKAIEHRLYIEEILPELKEKKFKSNKRKSHQINLSNSQANPVGAQNYIHKPDKKQFFNKDDGIYRGTRHRAKERNDDYGVYFKDNTWYATWLDSFGQRIINPFPVTNDLPFIAARNKAINFYSLNSPTNNTKNNYYQSAASSHPYYASNPNYYSNMLNYEMYKRRKYNMESPINSRVDGSEYFKNLDKKLDEEIEKNRFAANNQMWIEKTAAQSSQLNNNPQILLQNVQEYRLPDSESFNFQNDDSKLRCDNRLNPLHCQIKLERSILDEIEKAINISLTQNTKQEVKMPGGEVHGTAFETRESSEPRETKDQPYESVNAGVNVEEEKKEDKVFENVNALCISHTNSDKQTSIKIIPTYIRGPQETQLLTFVILNS